MTPSEEAAVRAAVAAARAAARRSGHRARAPRSAADALDERLELDWTSFDSRAYELLREVGRRCGLEGRNTPTPDEANPSGARYESRYFTARRRLTRAM